MSDFTVVSPVSDILENSLTTNAKNLESQYKCWALSIGKSEKTVKNYMGALKNSIPNWLQRAGMPVENLMSINSYDLYNTVTGNLMQFEEFKVNNARGNGMYSAAINSYQAFLADVTQVNIQDDIEKILTAKDKTATQKATLVNSRIGQGKFRTDLIEYWQGCALTRYKKMDFLIASHIMPWSLSNDKERLDPNNGFLLLANIDKAFDLGYITFSEKGNIRISECLEDYAMLGISKNMSINLKKNHQYYLAHHREITFKN
jgi:predicted restriction endonuclease